MNTTTTTTRTATTPTTHASASASASVSDVTVVVTSDDRATLIDAQTLDRRYDRTLVIDPEPRDRHNLRFISDAVLAGLGKDERFTTLRRSSIPIASGWLYLDEHDHAVICDASLINNQLLAEAIEWLTGFGLHVWIMYPINKLDWADDTAQRIDELADTVGADIIDHATFTATFPAPTQDTTVDADRDNPLGLSGTVILPRVDGSVFRTVLRDRLDPDDFTVVDEQLRAMVTDLYVEFAGITGASKTRQLNRLLRHRMHDTGDLEDLHLLVRAAQIAALRAGWHIKVDPITFFGAAHALPRRGQAITENWWKTLDRYTDPDIGATAALYLADIDRDRFADLNLNDIVIGADGTVTVTTPDGPVTITDTHGARFIRALVAWRVFAGAEGDDPVFVTNRTDKGISARYSSVTIRTTAEVGIVYAPTPIRLKHPDADVWLRRYGITTAALEYKTVKNRTK